MVLEVLAAVFATWNFLDGLMYSHEPTAIFQTGYLRELQVRRMIEIAQRPETKHYCEVGMSQYLSQDLRDRPISAPEPLCPFC